MKKAIFVFTAIMLLALAGCQKENFEPASPAQEEVAAGAIFTVTAEDTSTKSVFSGNAFKWDVGDIMAIFPGSTYPHRYIVTSSEGGTATVEEDALYESVDWGVTIEKECTPADNETISANVAVYPYRWWKDHDNFIRVNDGILLSANTCREKESGVFETEVQYKGYGEVID